MVQRRAQTGSFGGQCSEWRQCDGGQMVSGIRRFEDRETLGCAVMGFARRVSSTACVRSMRGSDGVGGADVRTKRRMRLHPTSLFSAVLCFPLLAMLWLNAAAAVSGLQVGVGSSSASSVGSSCVRAKWASDAMRRATTTQGFETSGKRTCASDAYRSPGSWKLSLRSAHPSSCVVEAGGTPWTRLRC